MLSSNNIFKFSVVSVFLTATLIACQQIPAGEATIDADSASSVGTMLSAPQALSVNASHYHQVQLAGAQYQFFTDAHGLHIGRDNSALVTQEGHFSRLTLQLLNADAVLLAAMDANNNTLYVWRFMPKASEPFNVMYQQLITSRVVDDLCFYQSRENQQLSVFLLGGRGGADQLLLQQQQQWLTTPQVIRELNVPYDSTACATDPVNGALYIAEAGRAIWRYQAEPEADEGRNLLQVHKPFGQLQGEVKALRVLADSSVLALEEEPVRLLHLSREGQLQSALQVSVLAQASGLSVLQHDDRVFISSESNAHVQSVTIKPLAAVVSDNTMARVPMAQVMPTLQTRAASQRGDVMDDPAVWHHPSTPALSLILATDKRAGLDVYNMEGERVQQWPVGRLNNVDVRYGMQWQGQAHDIASASLRDDNSLQLFAIDINGQLHNAGNVPTRMKDIYGLCMYHSANTGQHFVFVNDKSGLIEQYRIDSDGNSWQGVLVRSLAVPSQPEGCVADDKNGVLFVGEEDAGIWRFAAEPDTATTAERIIVVDGTTLVDDVEGIALANHADKQYLVVSSQGNDSYVIYDAVAPYTARLRFRVTTNPILGIDGSSETDGLDVTTRSLGPGFEQGALIVQDGRNRMPEQGQNLKLVPWRDVLQLLTE